jgi:beta-phosphoglucomutase-like phosphatase (HAD superfamily)
LSDPTPAAGRFSASIFDMDGLLIDSEILWHEAEIEIFGDLGVPLSRQHCRTTKGMFVGEVTEYWHAQYPWTGPTPAEVAVTIVDRVIALLLTKGELKPGAEHAIALCARRGLPLAVASSSQYRLIDTALDHFGLRHHFTLVHSAQDETWGKPHPAVFLTAAAKLGAAPRRCPGGRGARVLARHGRAALRRVLRSAGHCRVAPLGFSTRHGSVGPGDHH